MKLLLVSNLYPTPTEPNRGIFVHQLARRLAALCELTVVCPLPWFPDLPLPGAARWRHFSRVPPRYEVDGIRVASPKYPLVPKVSENLHASLMHATLAPALARLHERERFDVMNTQWLYPDGVASARIAARLRIPLVLTALGSDVNVFATEPRKWSQVMAATRVATAVTTVSQALADSLAAKGVPREKLVAILNGADHERFQVRDRATCRRELGLPEAGRAIVFVGRLVPIKGVEHLVAAAARLAATRDDFTVYLVGDGPLREALLADVRARGLEARVRWMGARPHEQVATWMGAADVFCLPSLNEGCPNVVLESLFAGRPVVASRVGGIPEMVDATNGLLPPAGDAEALATALAAALDRGWDAQALRRGVMHRTWEAAAAEYHRVFASASRTSAS